MRSNPEEQSPSNGLTSNRLPLSGELLFGRYSVIREIGRGGMGVVMLAHDAELRIDVALKLIPDLLVLDAEALDDLKHEVLKGMALSHPGIVRTHGLVRDENLAAIVMEYVDGGNFNDLKRLQPGACFDVAGLRPWVEQLCPALDYAHFEIQIAHRDLKPRNLMFTAAGRIKVADFGISSSLGDSMTRVTMKGPSSGTPPYMSPQQVMGSRPSHLDDVYALGATVYELLTGKPPFYKGDIIHQVLERVPPPMSERRAELGVAGKEPIPEAWQRVIGACLSKNPAARPQSAGEMLRWLVKPEIIPEITSSQPGLPAATAAERNPPPVRRRSAWRWQLPLAGVGVITVVGLANLPNTGSFEPDPPEAPPPPLVLTSGEILPAGKKGVDYEHILDVQGGTPPYALSVSSGELPSGLAMDAAGRITGIPQTAVQARFGVAVVDRNHAAVSRQLSLTITAPAPAPPPPPPAPPRIVSPEQLPDGVEGTTYGFSMSAEEGDPPFSWSLSSGGLPPGLELGTDGVIAGIPQTAGKYEFTIKATDKADMVAVKNASLMIRPKPPPPIPQLVVPHTNSLGMCFVKSGTENVYFSKWLTRVQDFRAFRNATTHNAVDGVLAIGKNSKSPGKLVRDTGHYWESPGFDPQDDDPVCCMSWDDAQKFCSWLTKKEHDDKSLPAAFFYRLPFDAEWRGALCLDPKDGDKPRYPWGSRDQPADSTCNLAGNEIHNGNVFPAAWGQFPGYRDPSPFPSPVDRFPANRLGIHDIYGNLWQFCEDTIGGKPDLRLMRGGSWLTFDPKEVLLENPIVVNPSNRYVHAGFRCVIALSKPSPE